MIHIKKYFYFLPGILYLIFRLFNLNSIPVTNDEGIYLNWGWKQVSYPNLLFASLKDGKQPLIIWLFGLVEKFIIDPVIAGRLVVICFGLLSFIALYLISRELLSGKFRYLPLIFYIAIPLFAFYDRQALLEIPLSACALFSFYFLLKLSKRYSFMNATLLGVSLGVGFWIKSTIILFGLSTIVVLLWLGIKNKNKKLLSVILTSFITMQIIVSPLYLQEQFWTSLGKNDRYIMSLSEILHMPIFIWLRNSLDYLQIFFWQLGPLVAIGIFASIFLMFRKWNLKKNIIGIWFVLNVILLIIFSKSPSSRYLVSLLPISTILLAQFFSHVFSSQKKIALVGIALCILSTFPLTALQLFNPLAYFSFLNRITPYNDYHGVVTDWTAGYGIPETVRYLKDVSKGKTIVVGVDLEVGNPQDSIMAYFHNSPSVKPFYLDQRVLSADVSLYDCLKSSVPMYFVSRDNQMGVFSPYFEMIKKEYKPHSDEFIGISKLRENCNGKSLILN